MKKILVGCALLLWAFSVCCPEALAGRRNNPNWPNWPEGLPVYDHIVIVVEENKDYSEVIGRDYAPYINDVLKKEGASFARAYGEEHYSQGNYFWLFSGDNQNVGFDDVVPDASNHPDYPFTASNLGSRLIEAGYTFKGYAESLPAIGSTVVKQGAFARKHAPWISFGNLPNGNSVATSSNLRFSDFPPPSEYDKLPTVAFVIPNLDHDMHNCYPPNCQGETEEERQACCIGKGDAWLRDNLDAYYQWAKEHNSLLIVTFDENDDKRAFHGLTVPMLVTEHKFCAKSKIDPEYCVDLENKIVTIFAGAHIKPGDYEEGKGITHVNILRTIEAMYGLPRSGRQQKNAAGYGIGEYAITDVFEPVR